MTWSMKCALALSWRQVVRMDAPPSIMMLSRPVCFRSSDTQSVGHSMHSTVVLYIRSRRSLTKGVAEIQAAMALLIQIRVAFDHTSAGLLERTTSLLHIFRVVSSDSQRAINSQRRASSSISPGSFSGTLPHSRIGFSQVESVNSLIVNGHRRAVSTMIGCGFRPMCTKPKHPPLS